MAEIVNLRRARKAKARKEKVSEAEANRAKFGTPAAMRKLHHAQEDLAAKRIDAHRIETEDQE
jgi:hypothetical protein